MLGVVIELGPSPEAARCSAQVQFSFLTRRNEVVPGCLLPSRGFFIVSKGGLICPRTSISSHNVVGRLLLIM